MNLNNIAIKHDQEHQLFFVRLQNGSAHIKYEKPEQDVIKITETYVPEDSRNYGLAGQMAKHVLDLAKAKKWTVIPECPFVESYIQKYPEYEQLVQREPQQQ